MLLIRLAVPFLFFLSLNAYSKTDDFNCMPSDMPDWEWHNYLLCPSLTTIGIPLAVIATPTGTTIVATLTTGDMEKLIINSKTHAASYVASDGKINSAYLERALIVLRKEYPTNSDIELAKAILAY